MDKPKISVALCTHNGEKFLKEQLESIENQTVKPDELVISDDNSTDRTLAIAQAFAQRASFKVKILTNDIPLRVSKNFEKALQHCSHEIIFLSDQDDVWLPQKIEKILSVLADNQQVMLVFSDAELVDENLQKLHLTQFEILRLYANQKKQWQAGKAIELMLMGNRITGCTVAVRKELVEKSLPFPTADNKILHDEWLGWQAVLEETTYLLDEPLTLYRQHENQQVGSTKEKETIEKLTLKQRFVRPHQEKLSIIKNQFDALQHIANLLNINQLPFNNSKQIFQQKLAFLSMRSQLPAQRLGRMLRVAKHVFNQDYFRFRDQSTNWKGSIKMILGDLIE